MTQFLVLNLAGFKKLEQIRFARNIYSYLGNVVNARKLVNYILLA